jgi:signal transduction histidine kinase
MGPTTAELEGNPRAISIIPHALIDNAIKYAPEGTRIDVSFDETPNSLTFRVDSWGPRILPNERDRIFDPFFRAAAAKERIIEGTGIGLAQAQLVAKEIGTVITVEQDDVAAREDTYRTRFRIVFEKP